METTFDQLTKGTEVYYTGDQANINGFGVILRRITDRWGQRVDVKMTSEGDDRIMRGISPSNFNGPGARFELRSRFDARNKTALDRMRAELIAKR